MSRRIIIAIVALASLSVAITVAVPRLAPASASSQKGEAEIEFENADKAETLFAEADRLYQLTAWRSARRKYEEGLALFAEQPLAQFRLGVCCEAIGDSATAMNAYRSAVVPYATAEIMRDSKARLEKLVGGLGREDEVRFDTAVALLSDVERIQTAGVASPGQKRAWSQMLASAIGLLEHVRVSAPEYAPIHAQLAFAYALAGQNKNTENTTAEYTRRLTNLRMQMAQVGVVYEIDGQALDGEWRHEQVANGVAVIDSDIVLEQGGTLLRKRCQQCASGHPEGPSYPPLRGTWFLIDHTLVLTWEGGSPDPAIEVVSVVDESENSDGKSGASPLRYSGLNATGDLLRGRKSQIAGDL